MSSFSPFNDERLNNNRRNVRVTGSDGLPDRDLENFMNETFNAAFNGTGSRNNSNSNTNPFIRRFGNIDTEGGGISVPRAPESSPQPTPPSPNLNRYNLIYNSNNPPRRVPIPNNAGRRWNNENNPNPTTAFGDDFFNNVFRDLRITTDDNNNNDNRNSATVENRSRLIKPNIPTGTDNRGTYNILPEDRYVASPKPPKVENIVNKITNVDLAVKANTELHKTIKYDIVRREDVLVIRRGQPFTIQISFGDSFDPKKHAIRLLFDIGPRSNIINGTKQIIDAEVQLDTLPIKHWGARQKNIQGNRAWIECIVAPNAPVGVWRLEVQSLPSNSTSPPPTNNISIFKIQKPIFILFNPWNKNDVVYMEDEVWRNEAVVGDVGKIWMGTTHDIHSRMWSYGQYEENVLNAACYALDLTRIPYESRGNPVEVARAISAIVNSSDGDKGVVEGNWSGKYEGGTPPTEWQGSVQILQKYYRSRAPVKYGQCWVFAGVTTTIMRCLGIPTRTITNFNSAHDTNSNLTVDQIFDEKMEYLEKLNTDSIWNFHVWNECYMARPDLPKGYGGWQLLDATPQERSGNIYRCGPVSVKAIRNGEVGLQFDTGFAFAEVNADVISWIMKAMDATPALLERDENKIGQFISCVKPNSNSNVDDDRFDLTNDYKPEEKTEENKASVLNALNVSKSNTLIPAYGSLIKDLHFQLGDLITVPLGKNLTISLNMRNDSTQERSITATLHLYSVYYTGVVHEKVKSGKFESIKLNPNASKEINLEIKADEYLSILKDGCNFHVTCLAVVAETNQVYSAVDDFSVAMPAITIKVTDGIILKLNKTTKISASFINPLKKPLKNCKWILEGPGIKKPKDIPSRDIPPESLAELDAMITPKDTGNKTILVSFSSSELADIDGYLHVQVVQ